MIASILALLLVAAGATKDPKNFWDHWGDGKAELSSYKLTIPRYGEFREGHSVMIFVTEDVSRKTRIKVESQDVPQGERVPVLKLNRVVKFNTGIYDYSVMTSVFSAVEKEFGRDYFGPMKISFTAQEWCGHVFQMLLPHEDEAQLEMHSYFQSEGDQRREIDLPTDAMYEDNLPIWIRELKGEVLQVGEKREIKILPSLWQLRAGHVKAAFKKGWIQKEEAGQIEALDSQIDAWKWTWKIDDRTETWCVEKAAPSRILKFSSSDGTRGEIMKSVRLPYWQLHDNDDLHYRSELGVSGK